MSKRAACLVMIAAIAIDITCSAADPIENHRPGQLFSTEYFGLHVLDPDGTRKWPPAGFGALRLWDNRTNWADLEKKPGQWNFQTLDRLLNEAEKRHVQVLLTLGQTPTWASARPDERSAYDLGGAAEPARLEYWTNYVRTVATRYKGRIQAYEIWNEVNSPRFWTGSNEKIGELAREAYVTIKAIDPAATVVSANMVGSGSGKFERFLRAGNGQYADVIGFHFYLEGGQPEALLERIEGVKAILAKTGFAGKPIWNTETGWLIPHDDGSIEKLTAEGWKLWKRQSPDEAEGYVVRALVLARYAGVERFYWYGWNHGPLGLAADRGYKPKHAAHAFFKANRWMDGASVSACDRSNTIWVCSLHRENKDAWLVWSTKGREEWPVSRSMHAVAYETLAAGLVKLQADTVSVGPSPILIRDSLIDW